MTAPRVAAVRAMKVPMVIWITTEDRISGTGECFQLQRRRVREKDGAETWDTLGYYATLQQAAQSCLDKAVARGELLGGPRRSEAPGYVILSGGRA